MGLEKEEKKGKEKKKKRIKYETITTTIHYSNIIILTNII